MNPRNAFALASLAALLAAGCASKPVEKVETVATINGEPVPMKDYVELLERKATVQVVTNQGVQEARVAGSLGIQGLRDLVERRLILQMAKESNLVPTDADVKSELEYQVQERPTYVTDLAQQGVTQDMLNENLKISLARERLISKGITVTMPEVEDYIKKNQKDFMEPEKVKLLFIALTDATKRAMVDKDLAAGQDFQTVAMRYSEDPNVRQNGAKFSQEVVSTFPVELQKIVRETPELKSGKWFQEGSGWFKFYVVKKTPAKKIEMNELRKRHLQRQMALEKGQATSDFGKKLADKIRTAQIDVQSNYLRDPWNKAFEQAKTQMEQQQKQMSAPPAGGGTPKQPPLKAPKGG